MPGYWQCLNGHVVMSDKAKVCPECRSDIVWRDGEPVAGAPTTLAGVWASSGESVVPPPVAARVAVSPWLWVVMGLAIGTLGATIWVNAENAGGTLLGLAIIGVGSTVNLVGVIAAGVRMGIDASDATR